ncbi:MAG: hypothetical protein O3A36_03770 [bacterium]|nr:hypothetical protein [bacterium]
MTATNLELELQKVGFEAREASVYLASLELGPSPVQKIAQRAGIPRATVYLVLDDLQNKGVVTTYEEGKKTYYVAEPPQHIADLVDENEIRVKQQKDTLKSLIPELTSRGQFEKGDKPMVKYYEGDKAVGAFLRDLLSHGSGEVLNILNLDSATDTLKNAGLSIDEVRARRAKQKIQSRVIYTNELDKAINGYSTSERTAKFISRESFNFDADISIRQNSVFFIPYSNPLTGVAIENKAIASSMKNVFELLWKNLP